MREDRALVVTAPVPVPTWAFVSVCVVAGALAVPVDAVGSPVAALVTGLVGFLALRLWTWSGLPGSRPTETPAGFERIVRLVPPLGLGLIVGLLLLGVVRLVIEPIVPAAGARIAAAAALPIWRRVVIIYVAAVGEELLFRLLFVSVVTGLMMRLLQRGADLPSRGVVRGAIALSAFAFGAAHLPAWGAVGPLSLGLALMVMALNGFGGVVFGYVFVNRGIVAAIWAHAGADCAIQLIGPLTQ